MYIDLYVLTCYYYFMIRLDQGFRELGRPQTYAVDTVKDIVTNLGVMAYIQDGTPQLSYFDGRVGVFPLQYASDERSFTVTTPKGALRHYAEASPSAPYKYLAIGELAVQSPGQFVAGLSFERPFRSDKITTINRNTAHLFIATGDDRFRDVASRVLNPSLYAPENAEAALVSAAYNYVPTKSSSAFVGAIIAAATARTDGNDFAASMKYNTNLASQDEGIKAAEKYDDESPELAERVRLTRHLLHQLNPDAALYKNPLAIKSAEAALNSGVGPIGIQEAHGILKQFVSEILAEYKPGVEYL